MASQNRATDEVRLPNIASIFVSNDPNNEALDALSSIIGSPPRCLNYAEVVSWMEKGRSTDLLQIELPSLPNKDAEALVPRADAYGARINMPVLFVGSIDTVDLMVSKANSPTSHWLCAPSIEDRLLETARILATTGSAFHDVAGDIDSLRLRRLADEVSRIARALSSLSSTERPTEGFAHNALAEARPNYRSEPLDFGLGGTLPTADEVRQVLRLRRLRERYFDPALFADPAWDMLLDLMAARLEEAQVAVSSLCIAASVPPTTALRWIKTMTDHRIFERCADPDDGRRIFIRLSDLALNGMARYFESAKKIGGLMI